MSKFSIDFKKLEDKVLNRVYKYEDVKHRLEKVAFDIVRFKDGDQASALWQVQSSDDGEYIVTLYEEPEEQVKTASSNAWDVSFSKISNSLNIFYKGDPICKVSAKKLGLNESELPFVEKFLPKKLASNEKLVKALLLELSDSAKNEVLSKYPELR
jgi:hypothetical protein